MQLIKLKSICLFSQHQNHSMLHIKKEKGKVALKNCFFQKKKLIFLPVCKEKKR